MSDDGEPADLTDVYNILVDIHDIMAELLALSKSKRAAASPVANVATDADLDSKYGDEEIRFDPRDWTGTKSYKKLRMSECSPEYLDVVALCFDGLARKNDIDGKEYKGEPQSKFDRRTAARARGWAARLRAGWKPKPTPHVKAEEVKW